MNALEIKDLRSLRDRAAHEMPGYMISGSNGDGYYDVFAYQGLIELDQNDTRDVYCTIFLAQHEEEEHRREILHTFFQALLEQNVIISENPLPEAQVSIQIYGSNDTMKGSRVMFQRNDSLVNPELIKHILRAEGCSF